MKVENTDSRQFNITVSRNAKSQADGVRPENETRLDTNYMYSSCSIF